MRKFVLIAVLMALLPFQPIAAATTHVVVNEVACAGSDWVELYNPTGGSVDISNWRISDRNTGTSTAKHEFVFPRTTAIAAHGYLVISQGTGLSDMPWGVDCSRGETVYLSQKPGIDWVVIDSLTVPINSGVYTTARFPDGAASIEPGIASAGKANISALASLTKPTAGKCKAKIVCKVVLTISNAGKVSLVSAVSGVKLIGSTIQISARKAQTLKIPLKLVNAAGTRQTVFVVKVA